ncbi:MULTISPECIES: PadR family transcriptional regulator [Exiguobacterium]|uniref:Transcriptional regulator, Acidobacterial, PadR-family n=1 Tax=Exiguobacterium aurantiacum TaxID=33987 RepID=A0A377FPZ0_9BACL|nr:MULTISPECIES: PadR family transcriptional regulator [Exiguobacterium]STO06899.1 transcriptional regulator, Acidobacterial, PadR-family [Exiguobacterium aurantiacum]
MAMSQMLKGLLEGCLLAIIDKGETYGYEMSEKLQAYGFTMVSEGSIYPVLLRMKKDGWVETIQKTLPSGGPKRKYYILTDAGRQELLAFKQRWAEVSSGVDRVLREGNEDGTFKKES